MQFIEVTGLAGVRSAVIRFTRPGTGLAFLLFPMIHLGEAEFYREVGARLRGCDLVIAEGVGEGSAGADALVASYQRLSGNERMGLVVQDIDLDALGVPVVNPDMAGAEFQRGFKRLPLKERALVATVVPAITAGMRLLGTRHWVARHLATEDLLSEAEETAADFWPGLDDLLVRRRDQLLVKALTDQHRAHGHRQVPFTVGVVYGAVHMRAASEALTALGYHAADGEWLTVFTVQDA
ncbi:hypothetical protein [Streptomyces mangrovisoli]|uniref:Uncharacterized protein n=1 Tax=Streptomyces mangrovisoli TaxID=1428628 RepID=A0A1J4NKD6_9ACTN|nr:hypothetical protein [Streptomyces mangrovisoli]OIJ62767.1 hypothetical protein WN71_037805 [Streptomyces mangrovisoli]